MENNVTRILGLKIYDRIKEAGITQNILTTYDKIIRSRFGFHELNENTCSRTGIIILQIEGKSEDCDNLIKDLKQVPGIEIQIMTFSK